MGASLVGALRGAELSPATFGEYERFIEVLGREREEARSEWGRFPLDVDAERALVWWAHFTPDALSPRQIESEAFADRTCARRWRILQRNGRLSHPIDLADLAQHDTIPLGPGEALRRVRTSWQRRQVLDIAAHLAEMAFDRNAPVESLRALVERAAAIVRDRDASLRRAVVAL